MKKKKTLWNKVKNYLGTTSNQRKMRSAEAAFDELMEKIQEDSATLNELENYLKKEFDVLEDDIEEISKEVEKAVKVK